MERLSKICKPSQNLFLSQLILLREKISECGGSLTIIHKFNVKIKVFDEVFFLKVNLMDNEYYLFSKNRPMLFFSSFYDLKNWFEISFFKENSV